MCVLQAAKVNPPRVVEFVTKKKQKNQIKGFGFIDRQAIRTKITCSLKIANCGRKKKKMLKLTLEFLVTHDNF